MATEMDAMLVCPPEVVLRREPFGGMAFHRPSGTVTELDGEAFALLQDLRRPHSPDGLPAEARAVIGKLAALGFLVSADDEGPLLSLEDTRWPGQGITLSAPETVHLSITARCNLSCPYCYAPREQAGPELTTVELGRLIDEWAELRVLQLAVGGGEPLLRPDLVPVLAYARRQGIVPNLTTNGTLLTPEMVQQLTQAGVGQVNVSLHVLSAEEGTDDQAWAVTSRAVALLLPSPLAVGVNLLVTPASLSHLPSVLKRLQALGVRRVTVLRPKPAADSSWYVAHHLRQSDLACLRDTLIAWQGRLHLEVDSSLVCLMRDTSLEVLRQRGVYGCVAGQRICTVWPDGRVTPCSFLSDFPTGNVRRTPFEQLWREGRGWEALRDRRPLPGGPCSGCTIASQCGGSRCLAWHDQGDLAAGDPHCPCFDFPDRWGTWHTI